MKRLISVPAILVVALLAEGCETTSAPADTPPGSIAAAPSDAVEPAPSKDAAATELGSLVEAMENIKPGERPPLSSDEAGWWMTMDKVERQTSTAGNLVRDPGLNAYVRRVVCRVAGPYCKDIRVYIVDVPHFNAMMAPNGMMQIWTGLILRVRNEAQLAAVIGHEIGHYLRRHTLQRMREVRSTSDALVFFQIGLGAFGIPLVGDIAALAAMGGIQANSRDHEREADRIGLELMVRAGYDPREASGVWEQIVAERDADKTAETPSLFLSSHPPSDERRDTLKSLAAARLGGGQPGETGAERFHAATKPVWRKLLRAEVLLRKFDRSQWLIGSLIEGGRGLGELYFYKGEVYRLRGASEKKDLEAAIAAYKTAIANGDPPVRVYRSLGLVYAKQKKMDLSRAAYRQYLQAAPKAEDRLFIESLLKPTS